MPFTETVDTMPKKLPPGAPRKKRGRPPHVPTAVFRQQVMKFKGLGLTDDQTASMLMISDETLRRYYRKELDTAAIQMNTNVAQNLYNIATDPDHKSSAQAAMFWAKTRMHWRETNRTEITGADGKDLQLTGPRDVIDSRDLSPDQRDALKDIIRIAMAKQIEATPRVIEGEFYEVDEDEDEE